MLTDHSTLQAALVGYQYQLDQITKAIAEIRAKLGNKANPGTSGPREAKPGKKPLSAAARKRIAAAQKKRWAAFHAKAGAPKPATESAKKTKRKMSPEAKARLVANLAKARAAKAVKRAA